MLLGSCSVWYLTLFLNFFFSLEDLDAKVRERYSGSKKQREGEGAHHNQAAEITFTKSPRDSPIARVLIAGDAHSHTEEEDGSNRGSVKYDSF